ncbi:hypothetical protein CHUAL_007012 [Chamberlinius hualienensis]
MPSSTATEQAAFEHVRDNIDELNGRNGVQDTDLIFLKGLMNTPAVNSMVKVQATLEKGKSTNVNEADPVGTGNLQLMKEIQVKCRTNRNRDAQELAILLQDPHFRVKQFCLIKRLLYALTKLHGY